MTTTSEPTGTGPATAVHASVAGIWQRVLGSDADPTTSFFAAGGTSMQAITLATDLEEAFGVEIDLADVFEDGSADSLSAGILAGLADAEGI